LPSDVASGGRHRVIKSKKYFGMKLQLKQEYTKQQALYSKRTSEIRKEEKKIEKDAKQQAFFATCDKSAMLRFLGLPDSTVTNNTNDDILRVRTSELRDHQAVLDQSNQMDVIQNRSEEELQSENKSSSDNDWSKYGGDSESTSSGDYDDDEDED